MDKIYFNPGTGFTGVGPLVRRTGGPRQRAVEWLEMQPAYTLHKPARHKYDRNKVIVSSIDEQWAIDLVDLQSLAKYNDGFKYILNCIDIFSKFAYSIPIKTKTAKCVVDAFQSILDQGRRPQRVQSDAGKEFVNDSFQKLLKQNDIDFFTVNSELKACVIERFNRTLKERMWRYFTHNNTYKYIDVLQDLVSGYNNSKHRTIGIEPANVNHENELEILNKAFKIEETELTPKFSIGDKVRISKTKRLFEKGYEPNWSEEAFIITHCLKRTPIVYKIKDEMGEALDGIFYEAELQKINKIDNVYIVEKVIKTRKTKGKTEFLVKWRGYPEKFNSWVENLIKL